MNRIKKLTIAALAIPLVALALSTGSPTVTGTPNQDTSAIFRARCAGCHAADASKHFNKAKPDAQLIASVTKGVKPKMPSYEKSLSAAQIKGIVTYMKQLRK